MTNTESAAFEVDSFDRVRQARGHVTERLRELGRAELADTALLVVSELATNALLHAGGYAVIRIREAGDGVRVEVEDRSPLRPVVGTYSEQAMTGRGLRLVGSVADVWGVDLADAGKVVWAELSHAASESPVQLPDDAVLAAWADPEATGTEPARYPVHLGPVPTDLLLDAKAHVDNLVREFSLAAAGAASGQTADVPPALAQLIETVVEHFAEVRLAIKHQALVAARAGLARADLELELSPSAADAAQEYLDALDQADAYCRAARLLTLETPPQHRVFRRWYVEEIAAQLRAAVEGVAHRPQLFEERLLAEIDEVARAKRASDRAARLYTVAGALAAAATPEAVAEAVLSEGAAALGASGGGLLLLDAQGLSVPGTVGYSEELVEQLRQESPDAELPAAYALRTGEPVWLETRDERDARFPQLAGLERRTVSMCAVPLVVEDRRIGAVRFSFGEPRLFDQDERRFVLALAAQCAAALDRARLNEERADISRRLQRSLLPPALPEMAGIEMVAVYRPFGDGVDVGGDFYDAWTLDEGRFTIAIGDAVGTGPEAAAVTALARHTLRALAMHEPRPEVVIADLNTAMWRALGSEETFCTALFGCVSVDGGVAKLRLASGGHPEPVVRRADGTVETIAIGGGFLGAFPDVAVGAQDVELGPGDTVVLYTDGVTDARRGDAFFGEEGLMRALAGATGTAAETAAAIEAAVLAHAGQRLADDMALLVMQVLPG